MKDAADKKLDALFASDPVLDNGFSARIEKQIRRQQWLRRLALPVAAVIGGAIAIKPLAGLVTAFTQFASILPAGVSENFAGMSGFVLPSMPIVILGGLVAFAFLMLGRLLEE